MRFLPLAAASFTITLLAGCASAPNQPTKELVTAKSPEAFSTCVMQKLQVASIPDLVRLSLRARRNDAADSKLR